MKIDYNKLMKDQINNITDSPKLLLHVCCAPCSSGVLDRLKLFDTTLYYYNPNTYPEKEYDLRFEQFIKLSNLPIIKASYEHKDFLNKVIGLEDDYEGGNRCEKCIRLRMEQSFKFAKENNFDYVTTTLSVSPHKNANYINTCGKELEQIYKIKYLYADFKKENGYLNSIKNSKELNLYRQDYCGCEFSLNPNSQEQNKNL